MARPPVKDVAGGRGTQVGAVFAGGDPSQIGSRDAACRSYNRRDIGVVRHAPVQSIPGGEQNSVGGGERPPEIDSVVETAGSGQFAIAREHGVGNGRHVSDLGPRSIQRVARWDGVVVLEDAFVPAVGYVEVSANVHRYTVRVGQAVGTQACDSRREAAGLPVDRRGGGAASGVVQDAAVVGIGYVEVVAAVQRGVQRIAETRRA